MDLSVIRSTTGSEKVELPRAPGKGLDSRVVVGLGVLGLVQAACVPDVDEVVIATARKHLAVGAPL